MEHRSRPAPTDFAGLGARPHYPPDLELEPRHIELDLAFDPSARTVRGCATTSVAARVDGPRSLCLNAIGFEDLRVEDADGAELSFSYDGSEIHLTWAAPFAAAEVRRVRVHYSVSEPISGLLFSVPDDAYPERPLYASTDHETERARYWLPCIDLPTVRTTYQMRLTAPSDLTILASGAEQETVNNGNGTQTSIWTLDYPCPSYLLCVAIGDFCRYDDESVDGVQIAYFGPRKGYSPEDLRRSFGRTPEMMRWLVGRLGASFPFAKYYQFALPGIPGAMENISLVSWDARYIQDETLHREAGADVDATNIHEMAHSYFGDAIVIRDHSHCWLKESWATYIETVWLEEIEGADQARYDLWINAHRYFHEVDEHYARPITTRNYVSSWQMFDRHTYPGGACRIHMLRAMLGDGVFWPAVRDYVARYSKDVVETDDFRRVLEKHSGRSLQRFFDQWIYAPGYPKLKARFRYDQEAREGVFGIEQTQKDDARGIGPFVFDLDLWWQSADGEPHRVVVAIDGEQKQSFVVPMSSKPRQVRIDPEGKLLRKISFNPGEGMLRRQLVEAEDIEGRILAARELIESGGRRNFDAVGEVYGAEPFWGVRIEMARALARSNNELAIAILVRCLESEAHPRVMAVIAAACGRYRDRRVAEALRRYLERDDLGYRARGTALAALAAQFDGDDLERLITALDTEGWNGELRRAALLALGRSRSPRAVEVLGGRIGYGAETDLCRPAAVRALAAALSWRAPHERRPHEARLLDLTRDPQELIRWTVAHALAPLETPGAAAAIETMKATFAAQDHPDLDRLIRRLRGRAEGGPKAAAKEQIERLEETVRKLEGRLQKLEAKVNPEKEDD